MKNIGLTEKLANINKTVGPVINELLTLDVEPQNAEVASYQCGVGGKRIRPALVVISGQIFGANISKMLYPAASIEIMHNATLIVDDIIDHSEFRRNVPTTWSKYGKSIAECTNFIYLASVFRGLSHAHNSPKLIDLYSKTLKMVIDGEIQDILFERSGREDEEFVVVNRYKTITKDNYFDMIGKKTAILLETCCRAGAICADANDEQIDLIGSFGFNIGMAFQIRDDILDIFGDEKELGKKIGKDIIEKKMGNYVILSALDQLDPDEKTVFLGILEGKKAVSDYDVLTITDLIDKTDAKQNAEATANIYIQDALSALKKLPKNVHNTTLSDLAKYIVDRKK